LNPLALTLVVSLIAVVRAGDDPPPDYCKQDPDWYLCQHYHQRPRSAAPAAEVDPTGNRDPGPATTAWSAPRWEWITSGVPEHLGTVGGEEPVRV
jgi:hypothetical protein